MRITRGGQLTTIFIDFETILGLAVNKRDASLVLENTTGNPFPTPNTGKIVRIDGKNKYTDIATGLFLPTGISTRPRRQPVCLKRGLRTTSRTWDWVRY